MKRWIILSLLTMFLIILLLSPEVSRAMRPPERKPRFAPLHIYLDSGKNPLAAYQFELKAVTGKIKIVGVEGGENKAFKEAPYYDPAALAKDRIIIAAFNTSSDLPKGRTRIATIHLQITGAEPEYKLKITVAGDAKGQEIPAELDFEKGDKK